MTKKERLDRVARLSSRLLDGLLTGPERVELNELLRGDPETCEHYLELAEIHALLVRESPGVARSEESAEILPFTLPSPPVTARKARSRGRWTALLASAAAVALLGNAYLLRKDPVASVGEPSHVPGVAVLSRLVDAEWGDPGDWGDRNHPPGEGETLAAGPFHLEAGLAQLEFFSGATLIVEGPAELALDSEWKIRCQSGRLRAFVPEPARGFVIETPDYRAVDLGTEFALRVDDDGESEVHVVEGEVRLDDGAGGEIRTLLGGDGLRASGGTFEPIHGGGGDFVDRREMLQLANAGSSKRYREWLATRDTLAADPASLVLFDFENQDPWDRQLLNQRRDGPHAAIIGARWTEGRWPGKGALEFKRITDRVRLDLPGRFAALSFAAWVRIEGFDRWLSSLFLTDGFEPGEVHWQISDKGELILGISGDGPPNTFSDPVIHPDDLGKWIHLAVTVDSATGLVRHYRDGEIVKEESRRDLPPLRIGRAEIGNWQAQGIGHPIRSFNGRIDEFLILRRALSPGEMAAIHRAGSPGG
ncbi:MAG: hypothetical protein GXX91_15350 [Verrucomicrobiaceae bacterium]|nr:hypothetical protein [Verrucomicrobiaceae bacterium]